MSDYSDLEVSPDVVLVRGLLEADRTFVDAERFKSAMRVFATGVVIVTVEVEGRLWGLTINSCCSISATPPLILISLAHTASCREPLLRSRRFGLSILSATQRDLAELGAVPGGPKYVDVFCEQEEDEPARVVGALAHLDCRVDRTFEVSDHTLVVGAVKHVLVSPGDEPLLYFNRTFHRLGDAIPGPDRNEAR